MNIPQILYTLKSDSNQFKPHFQSEFEPKLIGMSLIEFLINLHQVRFK